MRTGPWAALSLVQPRFSTVQYVFACCRCNKPFTANAIRRFRVCPVCHSGEFPVPVATRLRIAHARKRLKLSHRSILHTVRTVYQKPPEALQLLAAYKAYVPVPGRTSLFVGGVQYEGLLAFDKFFALTRKEVSSLTETTQIQFKIRRELHASFKALCAKQNVSMTDLFILFIEQMLNDDKRLRPEQETAAVSRRVGGPV